MAAAGAGTRRLPPPGIHLSPALPRAHSHVTGCPAAPTPCPAATPCRQKSTEGEAKLRAAVQDKINAQLEKAALERELKGLRAQAEKLTKNMDKVRGAAKAG